MDPGNDALSPSKPDEPVSRCWACVTRAWLDRSGSSRSADVRLDLRYRRHCSFFLLLSKHAVSGLPVRGVK